MAEKYETWIALSQEALGKYKNRCAYKRSSQGDLTISPFVDDIIRDQKHHGYALEWYYHVSEVNGKVTTEYDINLLTEKSNLDYNSISKKKKKILKLIQSLNKVSWV